MSLTTSRLPWNARQRMTKLSRIMSAMLIAGLPAVSFAADCAQKPGGLEYLGRAPDNSKSYWLSATNPGNYRLTAPGFPNIDTWSTSTNLVRLTTSTVVADDLNGIHKLDRLTDSGAFDCFLHSRGQTNPLLPPTWRPPAKPTRPEVIRPELPDLPAVVRPGLPDLPQVIRPGLPDRPAVVRPERPVTIELQGRQYDMTHGTIMQYCPSARFDQSGELDPASLNGCTALSEAAKTAPLTPGRDLVPESPWNAWADTSYMRTRNQRGVADVSDRTGALTVGADRRISDRMSAGVMLSINDQRTESLWGYVTADANGWLIGPYAAYQLSQSWSLFGGASVGEVRRDHKVLTLNGNNTALQYSLMVNAQGEYPVGGDVVARPKLGISYLNENSRDYLLGGSVLGAPVRILVDGVRRESGEIQGSVELNRRLKTEGQKFAVAYVEVGAIGNYMRQDNSLDPRWQGLLRGGFRMLAAKSLQIDLSASYRSLGVSDLSIWDMRLFAAYAF